MTKKAEKILNNYIEKINTNINLYVYDLKEYDKCVETIDEHFDSFEKTVRGMYKFEVISDKDFIELYEKCFEIHQTKREELTNKYLDKYYGVA